LCGVQDILYTFQAMDTVSILIGLSPDYVRRLVRDGEIKGKKLGHDWVVLSLHYQRKRKPKVKKGENDAKS